MNNTAAQTPAARTQRFSSKSLSMGSLGIDQAAAMPALLERTHESHFSAAPFSNTRCMQTLATSGDNTGSDGALHQKYDLDSALSACL